VTRQTLSVWGVEEQRVSDLKIDNIRVRWAARHGNKLRIGHLRGNRFAIRIRQVDPTAVVRVRKILDRLALRGMPNFFGEQRFGRRGDNHLLGACLVRGRPEELLHHLLGRPEDGDDQAARQARETFDRGEFEKSLHHWPRRCGMERRILARFIKTRDAGMAVRAVDERLRRLWISALQSDLFNRVLARRIDSYDRLLDGDFAYKHENGAGFPVESAAAEQERCDRFEISPSGPIVGYRMTFPAGAALEIEQSVLKESGLTPGHFKQDRRDAAKGTRRPLRVRPEDIDLAAGVDEHGAHITIAFTLPSGSFATVLMREIMKGEETRRRRDEETE
jgi:tRNA pseudouridine13 synthase